MIKKLRYLFTLMLLFVASVGWADQVTLKYSGSTTTNMTGGNDAALVGLDANSWSVVSDKGGGTLYAGLNKAGDIRLYYNADGENTTITVSSLVEATINSINITFTGANYSNAIVSVDGNTVTGNNGVYNINSSSFVVGNGNTSSNQVRISQIVINYTPKGAAQACTTPTIEGVEYFLESREVSITCDTEGASIQYSTNGTTWNAYTEPFTITETTTVQAKATKNGMADSEVASKKFTKREKMNIAQARAAIDEGTDVTGVFVEGIVSQVDSYNSTYGSITYWISDDGTTTDQFEVYGGLGLEKSRFDSKEDLQPGDEVVVYGNIKKYGDTYEFDLNSYLVSFNRPATPVSTIVSLGTLTNVTIELWDGDMNDIEAGSEVTPGTLVYVKPTVATGYTLEKLEVIDAEDNVVELTENNGSWSFTMPNSSVTINATAKKEGGEQPAGEGEYVKVTSTEDLTDGEYLIVYEEGNLAFNGSLETLDAVGNTISVTIANNEIAANETTDAATFTIETIEGGYSIKSASGLYIGKTANSNGLDAKETVLTNNISFATDGNANIVSSGGAYLRYNAASNQNRFRYYKSSSYSDQQAIQLYKKVAATPEPKTVTVTITSAGYATFANKKAVDFSGTDVTVMTAKYDATTGKIDYTEVESKKVPAGAAVVLKGEADDYTANVIESADALQNNDLQVNLDEDILVNGTQYCLAKKDGVVGFYKVKADDHVKAGKAYLVITDANAKDFYGFDDDATGIDGLNVNDNVNANEVFDLQGRRVARPTKGIYIVNGKKVVIKK